MPLLRALFFAPYRALYWWTHVNQCPVCKAKGGECDDCWGHRQI